MVQHFSLRRRVKRRVSVLRRCIRKVVDRILSSWSCLGKPVRYRMLPISAAVSPSNQSSSTDFAPSSSPKARENIIYHSKSSRLSRDSKDDLVALKISLMGDSQIGKTSFVVKYVGEEDDEEEEEEEEEGEATGLYMMDKTLMVSGARISYSIWEVGAGVKSQENIPVACKDSVAILFMFDLTSRCTLNSVVTWYHQARKWNQSAIPILIGTKFDDFIQLPIDLQWTIASQARAYAKAFNATLFFSSATYNINVNKIFKFITAKLFDLPWTVERNLTIGEPIIDF